MTPPAFTGRFARQAPIPEEALTAAVAVMRSGRRHRPAEDSYVGQQNLPVPDEILAGLFDLRLPLTFGLGDCDLIADHVLHDVAGSGERA